MAATTFHSVIMVFIIIIIIIKRVQATMSRYSSAHSDDRRRRRMCRTRADEKLKMVEGRSGDERLTVGELTCHSSMNHWKHYQKTVLHEDKTTAILFQRTMSILLIVGPKCTLGASHAAS